MILFVEYPRCITCINAKKWMDGQGVAYTDRNIRTENPTAAELRQWIAQSGLPVRRFFNTSGTRYRELGLKEKLDTLTEDEQIELLASDGMLVKRPLLITDTAVLVGFREKDWANAL